MDSSSIFLLVDTGVNEARCFIGKKTVNASNIASQSYNCHYVNFNIKYM